MSAVFFGGVECQVGRGRIGVLAAAALLVGLAGCGATAGPPSERAEPSGPAPTQSLSAGRTTYPLTIDNCGRELTFDRPPERVVILNGTSVAEVESLLTLGLEDHILANSQSYQVSDDPAMVKRIKALPTRGLRLNENFEVPREQVLALKPDLVISTWAGGFDPKIGSVSRDQLAKAGINSFVTPVNCAYGAEAPRPQDEAKRAAQSVESSYELLLELGRIFDVQAKAADYVRKARAELAAIEKRVAGKQPKNVLVVYPGMSMMNNNGLPAVFGGGIYDDIINRAGCTNPFAGRTDAQLADINAEALASAKVDVLVVGLFQPGEDAAAMAEDLFKRFPQWEASKTGTYTSLSDGFYFGPLNAIAVQKIADAAHGDR
jgi:iron complex transport system substrate-binding protein